MAKGFKHGAGGANLLNFKVLGGTSAPSNPKENTIWVNTDTEITSWVFAAAEPVTAVEGMVWLSTEKSSPVAFNALKKNGIQVYPMSAKQYVSGAWAGVVAKSYQNGAWVAWWDGNMYESGNQFETYTGGWTTDGYNAFGYNKVHATFNTSNIYIYGVNNVGGGGVGTVNKIDFSGRTKLKMLYRADSVNDTSKLFRQTAE